MSVTVPLKKKNSLPVSLQQTFKIGPSDRTPTGRGCRFQAKRRGSKVRPDSSLLYYCYYVIQSRRIMRCRCRLLSQAPRRNCAVAARMILYRDKSVGRRWPPGPHAFSATQYHIHATLYRYTGYTLIHVYIYILCVCVCNRYIRGIHNNIIIHNLASAGVRDAAAAAISL